MPQRCQERRRFPVTMGNLIKHSLADFCPTVQRSHVRFRPGFINENESFDVDDFLESLPLFAFFDDIFSLLFGSIESLFFV